MKRICDKSKLDIYFHIQDMEEVIDALDDVLFSACMYYLDVDKRGIPSAGDANNVSIVRFLLQNLRATIVEK